ncbi:MAG: cytochrome c [Albidovulum sp.]|nr:cytochrome c [Albidovulum sp.]MDE0530299.1 cytochrome c [Albidovulum sp.]
MKNLLATILVICFGAMSASAQDDPGLAAIEARQAIMSYIGSNMRPLSGIMRGRSDFEAGYVQSTGRAIQAMAKALTLLFPEGSEEGLETKALPAVFARRADFLAKLQALESGAAGLAAANSLEGFNAAFPAFAESCQSCHSQFRSD